ncbi:hypothetical protein BJY21_002496 [Kineosphaera limosa]|uniref:Uncharacterized protein n=1 Tax=Kineosphaera limosa NBRC 100340 TaxID=1184609 RepID=K6WNW8_9MICO|nr:hypothetical protein [Kineosphaera limosa]NYE01312.1 hypothetical protein [Kineosphaera limosa]GAB95516.1 hypothetical protein KILIM_021_00560 [Kineosphaera limosa NBRC 100340]
MQKPCVVNAAGVTTGGALTELLVTRSPSGAARATLTKRYPGADPTRTLRALGPLTFTWDDGAGGTTPDGGLDEWSGLALRGNALTTMRWQITRGGTSPSISTEPHGTGWGAITQLVDSPLYDPVTKGWYVYGLAPRLRGGALVRYRVEFVPTPTALEMRVRPAGSVSGFGAVKGLTLVASGVKRDVLLANTSTGHLITITVPRTKTMTTRTTRLRDRTWQAFERLVATSCGDRTVLLGVDDDTGRGTVYDLSHISGSRVAITRWRGSVPTRDLRLIAPLRGMDYEPARGA